MGAALDRSVAERKNAIAGEAPRLMRYACALLRDRREAEDLVHDCIVRALANLASWREDDSPRKWLFTILHNVHVDRMRARARRPVTAPLEDGFEGVGVPAHGADVTFGEIDRALAALPLEQRQCVLLIGLEGMGYAEAAGMLDVPVGTVMSRLSRGRERLRVLLEQGVARPATVLRRIK